MPNYEFHKRIGYLSSIFLGIILLYLGWNFFPGIRNWRFFILILVIYFFSNLPDMDHHMGRLRKYSFRFIFFSLILTTFILAVIGYGWTMLLLMVIGFFGLFVISVPHRGPMHKYWFIFLCALPLLLLDGFFFIFGLIAGWSHIFIDRLFSTFKRRLKVKLGLRDTYNINIKI